MRKGDLHIGVVAFPGSEKSLIPLANLVDVLCPLVSNLYLITGGAGRSFFAENKNVYLYGVEHSARARAIFTRAINYVWTQSRISRQIMKLARNVDFWIFFIGGEGLVLPILASRLLRKGVVIASAGSGLKVAQAQRDPLAGVLALLQSTTYRLSDRIIMYSEKLIEEHGLQKYRNKICIAHEHFIDFSVFKITKRLEEREGRVGYIGSLSKSKGVPNFIEAIPRVLEEEGNLEFLIGGSGQLQGEIELNLENMNLNREVKIIGWIPHNKLPKHMNGLKLLVLPSYTEGLPNIILEAMACGTPVLATAVGAIPDVIKDGDTGFIMEDNSPECIARNIIRALNYPNLEEITKNARILVEQKYTYEVVAARYRSILTNLEEDLNL